MPISYAGINALQYSSTVDIKYSDEIGDLAVALFHETDRNRTKPDETERNPTKPDETEQLLSSNVLQKCIKQQYIQHVEYPVVGVY